MWEAYHYRYGLDATASLIVGAFQLRTFIVGSVHESREKVYIFGERCISFTWLACTIWNGFHWYAAELAG